MRWLFRCVSAIVLVASACIGAVAEPARGQDVAKAEAQGRALAQAIAHPTSEAALRAFLRTLPVERVDEGGMTRNYYVYGGDTLMTEAGVRKQIRLVAQDLQFDPCPKALEVDGRPTGLFEECLARHPFVRRPPSNEKLYIFKLKEDQFFLLGSHKEEILERSRVGPKGEAGSDVAGLESARVGDETYYLIYVRCASRSDCDEGRAAIEASSSNGNRLIVGAERGKPIFWARKWRTLRYSIQRRTFPDDESYRATVNAIAAAAREWMDICPKCGVRFEHASEFDAKLTFRQFLELTEFERTQGTGGLRFMVQYENRPSFYAIAFFPDDPANQRIVRVMPAFLEASPEFRVGVLRHELGHVLGYRHEQIRKFRNGKPTYGLCYAEPDMLEGTDWKAATDYDRLSVMHYNCDSHDPPLLTISDFDKAGHRDVYGRLKPRSNADGAGLRRGSGQRD